MIDAAGRLDYRGVIDAKRTTNTADIATAHNDGAVALDEALARRPPTVSAAAACGCAVEYAPGSLGAAVAQAEIWLITPIIEGLIFMRRRKEVCF